MEQSPEASPTPSSGDVETAETIVLKKPAAVAETAETAAKKEAEEKNVEKQENVEVVTTIKVVKTTTTETPTVTETEEIIEEEVEESEPSISESEKEDTEVANKPVAESAEKKEAVAAVEETVVVKAKVPAAEKDAEPSEEEEVEEVEEEEEVEEVEEEEKEEAVVEKKEPPKAESEKKEEVVSSPPKVEASAQVDSAQQSKQENVNNTIKEIISDIDINIREQERIATLKQEELKLLQKQQELAQQIREQQLLAQKLVSQNDKLQQQYRQQQQHQQQQYQHQQQPPQIQKFETTQQISPPQTTVSKYSTYEESKDGNVITQKTSSYETEESSNVTKRIDLQKIFTPATDAEEILPKNRKLYASSAFYTPGLHPTVEDQVELARRISHSLSDISNHQSKGQSMYVNRKKRSVKWVHEAQDFHPHQVPPKPPTSPSILPAYSDAGKHRVQLNLHQEQVIEKYARPGLQVVKSPWEAALETGSASAAFVEGGKPQHSITPTPSPAPIYDNVNNLNAYSAPPAPEIQQNNFPIKYNKPSSYNDHQKDLAYKPSLAQGWKAPSVSLPKELYMPKEIPLESYAPPPVVNLKPAASSAYSPLYQSQEPAHTWTPTISPAPATISPSPYNDYSYAKPTPVDQSTSGFPIVNKPAPKPQYGGGGSSFPISASVPPKQQYWEPTSYQKVQEPTLGSKVPQVNFNPSPLPYDKLAKFENADNSSDSYPQQRYLAPSRGYGSKVRNTSPAPFAAKSPIPSQYSPPMQQYSNYGSTSYSPSIPSSTPTYGHHNPNELLHGPTFNNAARGWKSSGGVNSIYSKPRAPLTTGGNMPYTDF